MPAEPAHQRARQGVERADEESVVERALPAAVEARLDREPLANQANSAEPAQHRPELADAELDQHRSIFVLEADLHQLRQRVEPRDAVVDLEDRVAARLQ